MRGPAPARHGFEIPIVLHQQVEAGEANLRQKHPIDNASAKSRRATGRMILSTAVPMPVLLLHRSSRLRCGLPAHVKILDFTRCLVDLYLHLSPDELHAEGEVIDVCDRVQVQQELALR